MLQYEILSMVSLYLTFLGGGVDSAKGAHSPLQVILRTQPHEKPGLCPLTHIYLESKLGNPAGRDWQYHTILPLQRGPQPHCGTQTRHTGDVMRGRRESLLSEKPWSTQKRKKKKDLEIAK